MKSNDYNTNSSFSHIQVYTRFKEIYSSSKEVIEETIEPEYQSLRYKFKKLYSKEPSFFCRVPRVVQLYGDQVTNLFEDRIITTIERDFIVACRLNNSGKLRIESFDSIGTQVEYVVGSKDNLDSYLLEMFKYLIYGYETILGELNTTKLETGVDILISLNNSDKNSHATFSSLFLIGVMIYLHGHGKLSEYYKDSIYKLCITNLPKYGVSDEGINIYAQIFLERNSFLIFSNQKYEQFKYSEKTKLLLCESCTPEPPLTYGISNYWNKRITEVRLGLAMVLLKVKKDFSNDEIKETSKDFLKFLKTFDFNYDTIFQMIDVYVRKTDYLLKELQQEFGFNIIDFLSDIEYIDLVFNPLAKFNLYKRLMFVIKEYQRVTSKFITIESGKDISSILEDLPVSNDEQRELYECFSEEIENIYKMIKQKKATVLAKYCGRGWGGPVVMLGTSETLKMLNERFLTYYEKNESYLEGDVKMVNFFITDDVNKYCFYCDYGGFASILDPSYEDFMMIDEI